MDQQSKDRHFLRERGASANIPKKSQTNKNKVFESHRRRLAYFLSIIFLELDFFWGGEGSIRLLELKM